MQWFTMLILTVTATCDSLLIGLNYGVKQVQITWKSNLIISIMCFLGTCGAMYAGSALEQFFPVFITEKIGGLLLTTLGFFMVVTSFRPSYHDYCDCVRANPQQIDRNRSDIIEVKEALSLGAVLSANNVGVGLGASMIGMYPFITSVLCSIMSFVFLSIGSWIGRKFHSSYIAGIVEKASACLLLFLGLISLA